MRPESARERSPNHPGIAEVGRFDGFGALRERDGVCFRVFATRAREVELHVLTGPSPGVYQSRSSTNGVWEFFVRGAAAGDRYHYRLDGSDPRPDPASRFQPDGVHGPSAIVDPTEYTWRHPRWPGRPASEIVMYELHVGTFTPAGTFAAAAERLVALRDLGVTAIELMPVAEFAGTRNWGYDGVCLYAPTRNYGRPDDLRALVDAAHGLGIAVILDVVYNHLGPEGAYLPQFHPEYLTDRHETPWGRAVNLDGPGSSLVRRFIVDNAVHWVREYRLDGLRLDATHALLDDSPTHIVGEIGDAVRDSVPWPVAVHVEDDRNLASLVEPRAHGGCGMDGVWADDFHHVVRRLLAGDAHGYYEDYDGTARELARTIQQGWLFTGQRSCYRQAVRGTDPSCIPMHRFVVCLQNHDQIGNRAQGERLHHTISDAAWRAASTLFLTLPMTPLLFMGQEWAASSPFLFFTDLDSFFGKLVTEGRRNEFKAFPAFSGPGDIVIPDPQALSTFEASKLHWPEREAGIHRGTLDLYTELLRLRRAYRALGADSAAAGEAEAIDDEALIVRRRHAHEDFAIVTRLSGSGEVTLPIDGGATGAIVLHTEEPRFASDSMPPIAATQPGSMKLGFQRPGAVIVRIA